MCFIEESGPSEGKEGKSMTFPQALLPKLNKLTRCSLAPWRASVPGCHPSKKLLAMQCGSVGLAAAVTGLYQAGAVQPKASRKSPTGLGASLR